MIAMVHGVLGERQGESVLVLTDGGVAYEITVPLGVYERLPTQGTRVSLYTELVIREDSWSLYGFDQAPERSIFQRLLSASGFGPKLALALLSALGPDRTVRSIQNRDIAALSTVSGIGKKKAERLVLELQDRFKDVPATPSATPVHGGEDAVRALARLGYPPAVAEEAVREVLAGSPPEDTALVIRRALQRLAATRTGG